MMAALAALPAACAGSAPASSSQLDNATPSPAPAASAATTVGPPETAAPTAPVSLAPSGLAAQPAASTPPVPTPSVGAATAAPSRRPAPSGSSKPAPTPTPTPFPPAAIPVVPVTAGQINFGSAFDTATGAIVDPHATFRTGELAAWRADLKVPVGSTGLVWVIVQPLPSGLEFEHWRQPLAIIDPTLGVIVNQLNLWLYSHGGAGTYVMRYTRSDGQVLAEGTFQLVP